MGLLISEEWAADFSNAFGKNITVREGKEIKYPAQTHIAADRCDIYIKNQEKDSYLEEEFVETVLLFHETGHIAMRLPKPEKLGGKKFAFGINIIEDAIIDTEFSKELPGYYVARSDMDKEVTVANKSYSLPKDADKAFIMRYKSSVRTANILHNYLLTYFGEKSDYYDMSKKEIEISNAIIKKIKYYSKHTPKSNDEIEAYYRFATMVESFASLRYMDMSEEEFSNLFPDGFSDDEEGTAEVSTDENGDSKVTIKLNGDTKKGIKPQNKNVIICTNGVYTNESDPDEEDGCVTKSSVSTGSGIGLEKVIEIIKRDYSKRLAFENLTVAFKNILREMKIAAEKRFTTSGNIHIRRYLSARNTNDQHVFNAKKIVTLDHSKWLFVIDISGSTSSIVDKYGLSVLEVEKRMIATFSDALEKKCEYDVLVFSGDFQRVYKGSDRMKMYDTLADIQSDGGTSWSDRLYTYLYNKVKEDYHVVIFSDGGISVDVPEKFHSFITKGKYKPFIFLVGGYYGINGINLVKNEDYVDVGTSMDSTIISYLKRVVSLYR